MSLDVTPEHLNIIRGILRRHIPTHTVWAFGSRTQGRAHRHSDLDLCIVADTPMPYEQRANLKLAFSESDIPYVIDIVEWAVLSEEFREIIQSDKLPLQN